MKQFFEKTFNIYDQEVGKCLWLVLIFFSIFLTMAIFRSYVDTTFLKRYGASAIPEMLLINGGVTILVFGGLNRISQKFSDDILLSGFLAACALLVMLLFFCGRGRKYHGLSGFIPDTESAGFRFSGLSMEHGLRSV